tara:strand:- start:18 stop:488 length:471 start_codon:yes stop_codon:yes gene_type:complete
LINYHQLSNDDNDHFNNFIFNEGKNYENYLNMGWSSIQIINQLNKDTNLSFGAFYNETLVSFIIGNLFNIEKISEYEILLLYVSKHFRKKGLGTQLINKIRENNSHLKKIYIEVSKNNSEGIAFYTKMNFKTIYTRKNYFIINNKKIDAFAMSKTY